MNYSIYIVPNYNNVTNIHLFSYSGLAKNTYTNNKQVNIFYIWNTIHYLTKINKPIISYTVK